MFLYLLTISKTCFLTSCHDANIEKSSFRVSSLKSPFLHHVYRTANTSAWMTSDEFLCWNTNCHCDRAQAALTFVKAQPVLVSFNVRLINCTRTINSLIQMTRRVVDLKCSIRTEDVFLNQQLMIVTIVQVYLPISSKLSILVVL